MPRIDLASLVVAALAIALGLAALFWPQAPAYPRSVPLNLDAQTLDRACSGPFTVLQDIEAMGQDYHTYSGPKLDNFQAVLALKIGTTFEIDELWIGLPADEQAASVAFYGFMQGCVNIAFAFPAPLYQEIRAYMEEMRHASQEGSRGEAAPDR